MSTFYTGLTSDTSIARLGKPGGFAPLGLDSKVPSIHLPTGLAGGLNLQGGYDASTNTPDLNAGAQQSDGALYIVTVEGTQDIGNGLELFTVGDAVFYSTGDTKWYKLEGSTSGIEVSYNNSGTAIIATNVQDAIDEVVTSIDDLKYVDINSTGAASVANGTNGIAIGPGITTGTNDKTIAIGTDFTNNAVNSVAIGHDLTPSGGGVVVIGRNLIANSGSVLIGQNIDAAGVFNVNVGIGSNLNINGTLTDNAIVIGRNGTVGASNAVQLCAGTNNSASTLQYLSNRLANAQGLYTSFTAPTNYTPADTDNVTSHFQAIDVALAGVGPDPYVSINSTGTAASATGDDGIAIGEGSSTNGVNSIAIGKNAVIAGGGSAIQLGTGTNSTGNTLQYSVHRLATAAVGLYTSHVPVNYTPVNAQSVTLHFAAIDAKLGALGGVHLYHQTERTTLTANRTLTNTDKGILNVEVDNASFNTLTLPAAPDTDRRFLIRNRPTSTFDLVITGQDTLPPGALWEAVYDGVEWIVI